MAAPILRITTDEAPPQIGVDMTHKNPTFSYIATNPFIIINPPQPQAASAVAYSNFNTAVINLAMFAPRITISFMDSPAEGPYGVGAALALGLGADPFNLVVDANSTPFQILVYLSQIVKERKRLYVNSSSNYVLCHIASYRASLVAGQLDLVNHNLELVLAGVISQ